MISKRTLVKWRKEALAHQNLQPALEHGVLRSREDSEKYVKRVLEMTQELIDRYLLCGK